MILCEVLYLLLCIFSTSNCLIFLVISDRTRSDIVLYVVAYPENKIQAYSFVTVYCLNFVIFLCVTLELFYLSFVPLLAPNPGDATDVIVGNVTGCTGAADGPDVHRTSSQESTR